MAGRTAVNIPISKLVAMEPTKYGGMQWRCLITTCQARQGFLDAETALDDFAKHLKERHGARGGVRKRKRSLEDASA